MTLDIKQVADNFSVSPQLSPADFAELAGLGIRSVINNRPDGEGGASQPPEADLRAAADAAGLFYAYLPVTGMDIDERAAMRMRALIGELPKPILAFCRTGNRSSKLYDAACSNTQRALDAGAHHQEKATKANVGSIDRTLRIALGLGLIGAALTGTIGAWGWIGILPLTTGAIRFCPAYVPFALTTCRVKE